MFLFLQIVTDSEEVTPDKTSQIVGTNQSFFIRLLQPVQAVIETREQFAEECVAPSSMTLLCTEEVEELLEHQVVQTGALCLLHFGDVSAFPRKLEIGSVI